MMDEEEEEDDEDDDEDACQSSQRTAALGGGGSDGPAWQQRQHPHRSRKQYHIPGRRERQDPSEPHFRSHLEWKPSTSTMWEP